MKRFFSVVTKPSHKHPPSAFQNDKRERASPPILDDDEEEKKAETKQNTNEMVKEEFGLRVYRTVKVNGSGAVLKLACGSVINFKGTAIVNAANERGLGGGGVDGAINAAGGEEMVEARRAWKQVSPGVRIPAGEARVTPAFGSLTCKQVIHAVSADYNDTFRTKEEADQIVQSAYRNALKAAAELKCTSIAFSLLSAGIYRGDCSLEHVLEQGILSIKANAAADQNIYLVAFTDTERDTLKALFTKHFSQVESRI